MSDYNGWTNYETWCVNLWLTNDEGLSEDLSAIAARTTDDGENCPSVRARAERLKEYTENLPEVDSVFSTATFVADMLRSSLDNVNWGEIVENHETDNEPCSR